MDTNELIEKERVEIRKAYSELQLIVTKAMSEDDNLTEEEWYNRIGLNQEDREKKFNGWSEKEINQYQVYSTRRERIISQLALQSELKKLLSTIATLDIISKETKND